MNRARQKYLFSKYLSNTISKYELKELLESLQTTGETELDSVIEELKLQEPDVFSVSGRAFDKEKVFNKIHIQLGNYQTRRKMGVWRRLGRLSIAAAILIGIGVFIDKQQNTMSDNLQVADPSEIELPDHNRAMVTFEDGRILTLFDLDETTLKREGIQIDTTNSGELLFIISANSPGKVTNQTFYSPKGVSSRLVLADGSTVWLNSGSKITYPTSFSNHERRVSLEGEAFFDVQHNNSQPFIVTAKETDIKVLGTEFNVATNVEAEKTITTLITGSVDVLRASNKLRLKPGDQSISSSLSEEILKRIADVKEVMAWKEGYFRFKDDDVLAVLGKIKTWYDIQDIEIKESTSDRFTGSVLRTRKLSDLLGQLEKISNYKFKIMEGRVIVMK